jgi:competence protein ComEA
MRISEFIKRIKSFILFLTRHSAFRIPHLMRYFSLGQQRILFILALFLLAIIYFRFYHHSPSSPPEENVREFVIEVAGEVRNPGVYIFKNPPTLKEAIERAGGFKGLTQFDKSSSSETIKTGTLVTITKESHKNPPYPPLVKGGKRGLPKEEVEGMEQEVIKVKLGRMEARKLLVFSIPLDLNRVTMGDLCLIPGIGESLAREIVTHRERRKGFRSVEELKNVKGIGEKKFQSFKSYLIVRP